MTQKQKLIQQGLTGVFVPMTPSGHAFVIHPVGRLVAILGGHSICMYLCDDI